MTPVLTALILKRFRSVPAEQVTFANPTVLVGQNGSGKSNFVDAFAFLAEAMYSPLQAVFDRRGGISAVRNRSSGSGYPPNLGLGVIFGKLNGAIEGARYAFEVRALKNYGFEVVREQCVIRRKNGDRDWFDRAARKFQSNRGGLDPALEPSALVFPLVGGDARFNPVFRFLSAMRVYSIEPSQLREMQDPDSGTILRSNGSNAASVLQEVARQSPEDWERICNCSKPLFPRRPRSRRRSMAINCHWSSLKNGQGRRRSSLAHSACRMGRCGHSGF